MPVLPKLASLWRTLFRSERLEEDLADELRQFLDASIDKKVRGGLDPASARRAALLEMGGLEGVKQDVRGGRIGHSLETTLLDARYAWRSLRRAPSFSLVAVSTLALGIAGSTAVFSVVRALLLQPLPYRDPDRLAFVWADLTNAGYPRGPLAGPELHDLRERSRLFSGFGGIWPNTAALTGDGDPEQLRVGLVTASFFPVLGAEAALGRTFSEEDEALAPPPSILLSFALWQRRYAADPAVVGRRILVDGALATVVGVMPREFRLLLPPDANVPDDLQAWRLLSSGIAQAPRGQQFLRVVGRMRPGVSLEEGREEIAAIGARVAGEVAEYAGTGWRLFAVGLQSDGMREVRPAVLTLFAGVLVLLLIACVNVACLLVARAVARERETALRLALGAGRVRLCRLFVVEGLVLATAAGLLSMPLAWGLLRLLLQLRPETLSRIDAARLDPGVFLFTAGTAMAFGVLLSLAPLAELLRTNLRDSLARDEARAGGGAHAGTRAALVVAQLALGAVLVVSSSLLVRGFLMLQRVDPGFSTDEALTFRIALATRYRTPEAINGISRQLEAELRALPGVRGVGGVSHLPYDNLPNWSTPYLPGENPDRTQAREADARAVTPGYFETVRAHLVDGRFFTEDDDQRAPSVAVVDERLARRLWPQGGAVGRQVLADPLSTGEATTRVTVVGVVRHLRHRRPTEEVREQIYFPQRQVLRRPLAYVLRTATPAAGLAPAVRAALGRLDPELPVYDVRPLADYALAARAVRRFTMLLASAFAALALLLGCVGVYGVIAYSVTRRRRELGLRVALGARPGQVVGLVMWEGLRLAATGLALGLAGTLFAARLLEAQLFGVTPHDWLSYASAAGVLWTVALFACWLPARRSVSVSPMEALRSE